MHPPPPDRNIHWIDTSDSKIGAERMFLTQHCNNQAAMVKYTIAMLQAMVGAKPTNPIGNIHERPTLITLCHLQCQLINGLRKVGNIKFPLDGHIGYILSKQAFALFLSKEWGDPKEVGGYYETPVTTVTETEQQTKEKNGKSKIEERDLQKPENCFDKDVWGGPQPCRPLRKQGAGYQSIWYHAAGQHPGESPTPLRQSELPRA